MPRCVRPSLRGKILRIHLTVCAACSVVCADSIVVGSASPVCSFFRSGRFVAQTEHPTELPKFMRKALSSFKSACVLACVNERVSE